VLITFYFAAKVLCFVFRRFAYDDTVDSGGIA